MEECRFHIGDIVQHFKRENVNPETAEYLYRILAFAQHTENGEKLVIYQALYHLIKHVPDHTICFVVKWIGRNIRMRSRNIDLK